MLRPGWETDFHVHALLSGQVQAMDRPDCVAAFRFCRNRSEADFISTKGNY